MISIRQTLLVGGRVWHFVRSIDHSPKVTVLKTEDHFDPEFPKSEVIPVVLKRRNIRKYLISSQVGEAEEFVGIVVVAPAEGPLPRFGGDLAPEAIIALR